MTAGVVSSAGRLIDVWLGERGEVWRVLLLPFLALAAGLFVYGAAIYVLAVNHAPEFPILAEAGLQYFVVLSIAAGICLAIGLWLQHSARRSSGKDRACLPAE